MREKKTSLKERTGENEGKTKKKSHFFGFMHCCYQSNLVKKEFLLEFYW